MRIATASSSIVGAGASPKVAAAETQALLTAMANLAFMQDPVDGTWSFHPRAQRKVAEAAQETRQPAPKSARSLIVILRGNPNTDPNPIDVLTWSSKNILRSPDIQQCAGAMQSGTASNAADPRTPRSTLHERFLGLQGGMYFREPNPARNARKLYSETPETSEPVRERKTLTRAHTSPQVETSIALQTPAKGASQAASAKRRHTSQSGRYGPTKRQTVRKLAAAPPPLTNEMHTRSAKQRQLPTPPHDPNVDTEVQDFLQSKRISEENSNGEIRPTRDVAFDERYAEEMKKVLDVKRRHKVNSVHKKQSGRILDLLSQSKVASEDEALFLSTAEAEARLATGVFFNGPIVTVNQQALPLETPKQFLDEHYDDDVQVSIQDSSAKDGNTAPSVRSVGIGAIKARFAGEVGDCPWNALELATHQDDGLRPMFLNTEDCRLLTKLKIPKMEDRARRRIYEPGYKEVEKWALLAQAGALTEPHQDSHGYSTFITLNTGCIGFGWLSHPTQEVRAAWRKDPLSFRDGNWRYVVLKPGQTVYFPAGTVHHVFRLPAAGHSLAYGGHVLRCSNIVHWARTILEEHENQNITNEDLTDSATGYLARVEKFVTQAKKTGQQAKWGGAAEIEEFLRLKADFDSKGKPGKGGKGGKRGTKRSLSSEPAGAKVPKTPKTPKKRPKKKNW